MQQPQPLAAEQGAEKAHSRDVAARPVEAGDEPSRDRIAAGRKDDRNLRSGRLGCEHRGVAARYDDLVDHCCVAWNKLVNQPWRIMSIGLRQWAHRF